jgi:aminoglycoside phosphotransferase
VPGLNLAKLAKLRPAGAIVGMLASALREFDAADASGCPFGARIPGDVLVHGDACLPNILFREDGTLSGYIDLGDIGIGDREVDLSAAVWSLRYNLGSGHGLDFLRAYGLDDATGQDVERLWHLYADSD